MDSQVNVHLEYVILNWLMYCKQNLIAQIQQLVRTNILIIDHFDSPIVGARNQLSPDLYVQHVLMRTSQRMHLFSIPLLLLLAFS